MTTNHVTADELRPILGERWAICRNTEKNRARATAIASPSSSTRMQFARLSMRGEETP